MRSLTSSGPGARPRRRYGVKNNREACLSWPTRWFYPSCFLRVSESKPFARCWGGDNFIEIMKNVGYLRNADDADGLIRGVLGDVPAQEREMRQRERFVAEKRRKDVQQLQVSSRLRALREHLWPSSAAHRHLIRMFPDPILTAKSCTDGLWNTAGTRGILESTLTCCGCIC